MIDALPPPLRRTTTVQRCAEEFVKGIAGRKRHVHVPGWVGASGGPATSSTARSASGRR